MPRLILPFLRPGSIQRNSGIPAALLALCLFLIPGTSRSAVDTFLLLDGVPGESTAAGYPGWTEVLSFSHGIALILAQQPPRSFHQNVSLTKYLDKGSPTLNLLCSQGSVTPTAMIEFVRTTPTQVRFYQIVLSGVFVTSVSASSSTADRPVESIGLAYERIDWTYTQLDLAGQPLGDKSAQWNVIANTGAATTDTDSDGMPDYYETRNGLNPAVNDAQSDLDGDALSNRHEFLAGTRANHPNSVFRVTKRQLLNGNIRLTWSSVAGKTYEVHAAGNADGPYSLVSTVPSAGDGETVKELPASANRQFFLIRVR